MLSQIKHWWAGHGTKILGAITGLVGVAGECLALIQAADPKRATLWALVIGLSGAIIRRGFTNTQNLNKDQP